MILTIGIELTISFCHTFYLVYNLVEKLLTICVANKNNIATIIYKAYVSQTLQNNFIRVHSGDERVYNAENESATNGKTARVVKGSYSSC